MEIQKFEFTNYEVPVEIGGYQFTLDCSSDTGDYLQTCAKELQKLSGDIVSGAKTREDALDYSEKMIDTLLGAGASCLIFSGRKKRLSDMADILLWLVGAVEAFQEKRAGSNGEPVASPEEG